MKIAPFETEQFFAEYEFNTPYQLCNSDCESVSVGELLAMADATSEDLAALELGYTESRGNPDLRAAIATQYQNVAADDVVVLGTPIEGIFLVAHALLEPGDEVIVLTPAYDALVNVFEHVVGSENVKRWRVAPTETGWSLDLDELRDLISARTRLVVVNFPHNPTGFLPSAQMLQELAEIIELHEIRIFCDEMFFGLVHAGASAVPSAADVSSRSIVLSGLSKAHGLPGLRSGWLVIADEALRESVVNWKFYTSICPPAPTEFLAMIALQVADELRGRNLTRIADNLALAEAFFDRWSELFVWRPPVAGTTALVACAFPSVAALTPELARQEGILIHSGSTLGSDDQHMRLGFGKDGFGAALARFEDWLARSEFAR